MHGHSFGPWFWVVALLLSHVARTSASLLLPIRNLEDPARKDGYIVTFKPSVNSTYASSMQDQISHRFGPQTVRHRYNTRSFRGFAGTFNASQLAALKSSPFIQSIEPDSLGHVDALVTQRDAPWGLQRISQEGAINRPNEQTALDYTYIYDESGGAGVDIYIIDSGININHVDFGGRASWGTSFGGYTPDEDGLGHGTHVAGTAGGTRFGVAKKANLIAVRVLDSSGNGYSSDCISAVQWVMERVSITKRPSVINISIKFSVNDALDAVVTDAVDAGIHVVVSAGNQAREATNQSPARAAAVTTVGASDTSDSIAFYSNYGPVVDIFAPGSNVTSAWIGSNTAFMPDTGTSMAAPHVAGLTAYLIGRYGNMSPAAMLGLIKTLSPPVVSNMPSDTTNQLVGNGVYTISPATRVSLGSTSTAMRSTTGFGSTSATLSTIPTTSSTSTTSPIVITRVTAVTPTPEVVTSASTPLDEITDSSPPESLSTSSAKSSTSTSTATTWPVWPTWWWPPRWP